MCAAVSTLPQLSRIAKASAVSHIRADSGALRATISGRPVRAAHESRSAIGGRTGGPMLKLVLMLVVMVVGMAASGRAQDRMPPIPADKLTDAQKKAIEEFKAARAADISGPFVPLLRSPEVMSRARAMGDYLRFKSSLPPRLSEFVILLTARHWTQQYEWNAHQPLAIQGGLRAEIVGAIAAGRRPAAMAEDEAAVYALWDEVQRTKGASDAVYARAVEKVGEQGVIDVLGITGYYTMLAMVMNTTRTPLPAGVAPPLPPLPR
jgi:4-carboxymuconolactone decarboxylase